MTRLVVIVFLMSSLIGNGLGANVLCVAPFPAISHYQMLEPLLLGLHERGHKLTILSHFPQKKNLPNLTEINLRGLTPTYDLDFTPWSLVDDLKELFSYGNEHCKMLAESEKVQKFLRTREKFDLIFVEVFDSDCYLGLVSKFKAPFILFSALPLPVWESDWIYNPTEPGYLPENLCRLPKKMNFFHKLQNVGCLLFFRGLHWINNRKTSVDIARKYFQADVDTFHDIKRNVSLIFVNSFHGVTGVRPFFPNVIEIGGIHIKPPRPLPENIESFLKESSNGVVVISMGSIVKGHTLNPEAREGFVAMISQLKERVLWKWEAELDNKPDNLMTVSWFPQSDVLGHPNVKLFISHGGIHGIFEAVYHGVPVLGIPLFGDQIGNLKSLEYQGAAQIVDFNDLNEKTLSSAVQQILNNESYKINAKRLSSIFRDRPETPLEKAIFWTEHVIRHKGTPHFQSGALKLSWLQYALIDVLFVCFSFCISLIVVFHYSLKFLKTI